MNIETTDNSPLLQECIEELINSKIDEGKGRNAGNKLSTFLGPRVMEFTFADLTTDFLHHYLLWLKPTRLYGPSLGSFLILR